MNVHGVVVGDVHACLLLHCDSGSPSVAVHLHGGLRVVAGEHTAVGGCFVAQSSHPLPHRLSVVHVESVGEDIPVIAVVQEQAQKNQLGVS